MLEGNRYRLYLLVFLSTNLYLELLQLDFYHQFFRNIIKEH